MAGVAALLYDIQYGYTKFNVGFLLGLKAFTAAVLGGIGNLRGALLGGLLLGVVENYGVGPVRQRVEGLRRLRRCWSSADVPADRPARRVAGEGAGMTSAGTRRRRRPPSSRRPSTKRRGSAEVAATACQQVRWAGMIAAGRGRSTCCRCGLLRVPRHPVRAIYLPVYTAATDLAQVLFDTRGLRAAGASGLNVVVGFAGLLDLGYFGFFAVGAYTVALLTSPESRLRRRPGRGWRRGAGGDRGRPCSPA